MNPLMLMLIRNTRKAIRQSADKMNLNAPFVAVCLDGTWHTVSAAHFMQATGMADLAEDRQ